MTRHAANKNDSTAKSGHKHQPHAPVKAGASLHVGRPGMIGFHRFARASARATGHPAAFGLAAVVIASWLISGPFFHFSDTWQLVINTATTIVTFLMVFLIQNTQNRDSEAVQLKLDELIRATQSAHNALLEIEELSEEELIELRDQYARLADLARTRVRTGKSDLGCPEIKK